MNCAAKTWVCTYHYSIQSLVLWDYVRNGRAASKVFLCLVFLQSCNCFALFCFSILFPYCFVFLYCFVLLYCLFSTSFPYIFHTDFRSGYTSLHSHQLCRRVPLPPHPHQHALLFLLLMVPILMRVRWILSVVLMGISLISRDVEHFFHIYFSHRIVLLIEQEPNPRR